jgi:glycosyltransferase involved in cell wall biosynthesis
MNKNQTRNPFFSIGITTYNRPDLLRQIVNAFLSQSFNDFELLIGNDYLHEPLTNEILGTNDERIIIINQPVNLGERENMNSLLRAAKGRYFSWQFDDDLCSPDLLKSVYDTLVKFNYPVSIYTSFEYIYGDREFLFRSDPGYRARILSGKDFLRECLSGKLRLMGLGGFKETRYLMENGGAIKLSDSRMGVYSEYLLLIQDGTLPAVAYIDSRLLGYRVHGGSYSSSNSLLEVYKEAGINLLRQSLPILCTDNLKSDFHNNIISIIKSIISMVIIRSRMGGTMLTNQEIAAYCSEILSEFNNITDNEMKISAVKSLSISKNQIFLFKIKAFMRASLTVDQLKYAHILQSFISRFTNKSF